MDKSCNIHFAKRAFSWARNHLPCVVLCFDIESFFDTLDHDLLKREWSAVLEVDRLPRDHFKVFKSLTQYSFVHETEVHNLFGRPKRKRRNSSRSAPQRLCSPQEFRSLIRDAGHVLPNPRTRQGIPQGSPMSGVLSNIYMLPFDRELQAFADGCGGFAQRYSDDVLLIVPPSHADAAKQVMLKAAQERRLQIHLTAPKLDEKYFGEDCGTVPLPKPVQYLGFTFDGKNIRIRPQTWSRQCRKARAYLRRAATFALENPQHPRIYRRAFQRRFAGRGECNFGSYARRSTRVTASLAVDKQWKQHQNHVRRWLNEANAKIQASLETPQRNEDGEEK